MNNLLITDIIILNHASSFCGNLYFASDNKSPEIGVSLGVAAGIVVDD